jgi:uncharacterized protein with HEPN domain
MKQPDDPTRAGHIVDAAEAVLRWTHGRSREDFAADDVLQSAVAYQLQIIGEAAAHLSDEFRQSHNDIPWRKIIAMRNVLAHGYMHVDIDRVWDTVVGDLVPLLDVVRPYAPPMEDE